MDDKLLTCPFCGSAGRIDEATINGVDKTFHIGCLADACKYKPYWCFDTRERAIEAWNQRVVAWHDAELNPPPLHKDVLVCRPHPSDIGTVFELGSMCSYTEDRCPSWFTKGVGFQGHKIIRWMEIPE